MALAHNLGFPRIGRDRELRAAYWQAQKDAGIELLPVGDLAWRGQVLSQWVEGHAFTADQPLTLDWAQLLEEVEAAKALGHAVKPVLIGPLTYLWLSQVEDAGLDALERVDGLLPRYDEIFNRLAAQGVEWVQIDEPILVLDLPQAWKNAYERVYNILQRAPLKKLVATYFGGLEGNLGLAANLPVDGLHIDLVCAPDQYPTTLDRLPAYKVLSLGLVNGRDAQPCDQGNALAVLRDAAERLGDRLWVAPSCPLLSTDQEPLDAIQKCQEVAALVEAVNAAALRAAA